MVRASDGHLSIIHRDSEEVFIAGRTASNEQTAEALSMNENRIPNRMNPHEVLGEE